MTNVNVIMALFIFITWAFGSNYDRSTFAEQSGHLDIAPREYQRSLDAVNQPRLFTLPRKRRRPATECSYYSTIDKSNRKMTCGACVVRLSW